MPKKSMRRRSRRGGDLMDPSSWSMSMPSLSNPFASKDPKDSYTSSPPASSGMGYSQAPASTGYGFGGRKGKRRRSMRGGNYSDYTPTTGLAANAASVSGVPTASAQLVGGRTRRRRRHKCGKSCRKH